MSEGSTRVEMGDALKEKEIVDFYQVTKHSYVIIYRQDIKLLYSPVEPELSEEERRSLDVVKRYISRTFYFNPRELKDKWWLISEELTNKVKEAKNKLMLDLSATSTEKIAYYIRRDYLGYGPIDVPMNDPYVEDISSTGAESPVYVYHTKYEWLPTTIKFRDTEIYEAFVRRLAYRAGQELVYANPIVEGPLPPKGYRAHLVLDAVTRKGASFTIRRGSEIPMSIVKLISLGTLTPKIASYIWLMISYMRTILIAGPMASGKTTLLNAISMFIPPAKKVVTIEETSELRLERENWTPLIVRPSSSPNIANVTLFELLKSSLRQRPDYIIVGEIRGEEAYTFFQAISLGHGGLGTIHAESVEQTIRRLESHPLNIPRSMIPLVNTMIFTRILRGAGGIYRKVFDVVDVMSYDPATEKINVSSVFHYDIVKDTWMESDALPGITKISEISGVDEGELKKEMLRREVFLSNLLKKGIESPTEVSRAIEEYMINPDFAMAKYAPEAR
jgi:flagellar protein FlaI